MRQRIIRRGSFGRLAEAAMFIAILLGASTLRAQPVIPPDPPPTFAAHVGGMWGPVIEWPHVAVSMANLPDGRILTFASNEPNAWPGSSADEYTHAAVWDPESGEIRSVPHPSHDMFCAALVTIESGETFVMGGRNQSNSPWVSYYDFRRDRWVQFSSDQDMNLGRWYPTALYLGSGSIFIAVGIGGGPNPELWTPGLGWSLLSGIDLTDTMLSHGSRAGAGTWPLLQLDPDGTVFHHGATPTMNQIDPFGGPGGLGTITDLGPHPYGWYPDEGVSVVYDEGKILVAGGSSAGNNRTSAASAYKIDINGPGPVSTPAAPMNFPRQFLNEVVLPNGDVIAVGGNTNGVLFDDTYAMRNAEVWDPDLDAWTLLNPQDQARTYHSTALLLLDGTVLSAGGGLNGEPCDGLGSPGECGVDHWNAEVFSPPYLFESDDSPATRPVIQDAPGVARVGRTLTVHATPGLSGFSLVRMSGTTHTMNTDQRFLRPGMVETASGSYELTLHANENVLLPGFWMLFALEGDVPSVAKPIQIVNDGIPRGAPIETLRNAVGDEVLYQIEVEDPDGNPMSFLVAEGLPEGLTLSANSGVIQGTATTAGLFNVHVVAFDGVDAVDIDFQWVISLELSELGTVTLDPNVWSTVTLEHAYDNPVVVMGPPSFGEADATTVRVRDVTSTSFEVRLEEWPTLDGLHEAESVSYLVIEAGEYLLPGGGAIVAGIAEGIDFPNPWTQPLPAGAFAQAPIVFAQIGTTQGSPVAPPATPRIEGVSATEFTLRIQEQESDNQFFPAEAVHWIALEPAEIPALLEAARSLTPIDEAVVSVYFGQGFTGVPHWFAAMQTTVELDPVTLRYQNASSAGIELFAQEETSADAEVDHAPEDFGWMAIDPSFSTLGLLPLFNQPPTLASPGDQSGIRDDLVSLFLQAIDPDGEVLGFEAADLPPGLSMNPSSGEISGTLKTAGTYVSRVTVSDTSGASAFIDLLWQVDERLELAPFATPPNLIGAAPDFTAVTNIEGSFEFEWDFGDGSTPVGPSPSNTTSHPYAAPGRYVVTLTVTDTQSSQTDTIQFVQIVVLPPTMIAPKSSSSIVYEAANDRVWTVNPDNASVSVIDAASNVRIDEVDVASGPRGIALAADGRIWVTCKEASLVEIIDPVSLAVTQTIDLGPGAGPHGIVFDASGTIAFVALEGAGQILRLDGTTAEVLASASVGREVRHLAITGDGLTLRATRFITPPLPGEGLGVPDTELGGEPLGAQVLNLDATTLAMGATTILEVSTTPDSEQNARGVLNYLGAPVISPDGSILLVPSKQDNVFRGVYRDGLPLAHDATVRAATSRVDLATGLEDPGPRLDHDNASVASASAFSRLGAYAFTTLEGNRQLAIVDSTTNLERGRVQTGLAPQGLALSPDGSTLYIDNFMDRSVSVFDLSNLTDFDDPDLPLVATVPKVDADDLPADVLLGKQLFYDAADPRLAAESYMACASCHAGGGHDGRVWDFTDFGEGLRNTISLLGHGADQGLLHWTGNFDEPQDFESQIRHLGGDGLMSDPDFLATSDPLGPPKAGLSADLDALGAYLTSLTSTGVSPARAPDGSLTTEALVGRSLFESEGCGGCHAGPGFTDSAPGVSHDVGTLTSASGSTAALDTPTLRGLWRTAPYLHNGTASTLEDAIAAHAFVTLSPTDLNLLAAYLEQIDDTEITAPNSMPSIQVLSPASGSSSFAETGVDLLATADDPEDGDLSASITWTSDLDGPLGLGGTLTVNTLSLGSHALTAEVSDSLGLAVSEQITVTILANTSPTVTISTPQPGARTTEGLPVSLSATATDMEDGDISATIVWASHLEGDLGTGASLVIASAQVGTHFVTASVLDSGGQFESALSLLYVLENELPAVTIISPVDYAQIIEGETIELSASAVDPEEGDIAHAVIWTSDVDGLLGTGAQLSTSDLSVGLHLVSASVTDSAGGGNVDQTEISVPEPSLLDGLLVGLALIAGFSTRVYSRENAKRFRSRS